MGQKVHPTGLRIGIVEAWRSRWYARKKDFGRFLVEDQKIRRHIGKKFRFAGIPKVEIERAGDAVNCVIHTAKPGAIIGRKGQKVDELRDELKALVSAKDVNVSIQETQRPELSAQLVAESIAEQLEKRSSFRRTMKKAIELTIAAGAKGCRVRIGGRLGGAEIARSECQMVGSIPLSTLRANIEYGFATACTVYGTIGVKVWIYLDESKTEATHGADAQARQAQKRAKR